MPDHSRPRTNNTTTTTPAATNRGIALMVLAMLCFAVTDMFIKLLANRLPTGQIILFLGSGGALIFFSIARLQGEKVLSRAFLHPVVLLRNGFEVLGTFGFVTALALSPLSTASAILQANPLIVTLGAALFLHEPVGPRRWAAIILGLAGVLLIIQPWSQSFVPASLFAVLAVFCLAIRDLATRRVPSRISTSVLSTYALTMLVPLGACLLALPGGGDWVRTDLRDSVLLVAAILSGALAYFSITGAMRVGDVGVVTPFRYCRILFALAIAAIIFDERIDKLMLAGVGIVVASGLYTLWRMNTDTTGSSH